MIVDQSGQRTETADFTVVAFADGRQSTHSTLSMLSARFAMPLTMFDLMGSSRYFLCVVSLVIPSPLFLQ